MRKTKITRYQFHHLFKAIIFILCIAALTTQPAFAGPLERPLLAPLNVVATDGDHLDKVAITWEAPGDGGWRYKVYRCDDPGCPTFTTLSEWVFATNYNDTGGTQGVVYYYKVESCAFPDCYTTETDSGYKAVTAPTGLTATDGTYTDKVAVTWSGAGTDTYSIYRHTADDSGSATLLDATLTSASYDDLTAIPGTTYYYWVKECVSAVCSAFSGSDDGYRTVITGTPSNVSATDGTNPDKVTVTFDPATGETRYEIYRSTTNDSATSSAIETNQSSSPYDDTSATPGTQYYYWVKACGGLANCGAFSTVDGGYAAISPPESVSATDGSYTTKVALTWASATGAGSYEVYRDTDSDFTGASLLDGSVAGTSYDDTGATPGVDYWYWVKSTGADFTSSESSSDQGYRAMSTPQNIAATDGAHTDKVAVTWDSVSGAVTYKVYRDLDNNFSGASLLDGALASNSYDDTSATPGVDYFYWVSANGASYNSSENGPNAGWRAMSVPQNVSATGGTFSNKVTITWDSVTSASSYKVYRDTDNTFAGAVSLNNAWGSTTYNDITVTSGTVYYYWIIANGASHSSAESAYDDGYSTVAPPTGLNASDGAFATKVAISWNDNGEDSFKVYRNSINDTGTATLLDGSVATNSYDDVTAAIGQGYYYWVKGCVGAECSDFSTYDTGYVATAGTPANAAATDGTYTNKVAVSWDSVAGISFYQVFRSTTNASGTSSLLGDNILVNSYDDSSATPGTQYYFWVKACGNPNNCSDFSNGDGGYATINTPSSVSATDGTNSDKVALTWGGAAGANDYKVYRHTVDTFAGASLLDGNAAGTSYDDTSATPGTDYFYWVVSNGADFSSSESSSDTGWRAVGIPQNVSASDGTFGDKVRVTWDTVSGAATYSVYRHDSDNFGSATLLNGAVGGTGYNDTSAALLTSYYYWVVANAAGHSGTESASDTGFRVVEGTTIVSATDGDSYTTITVTWNASPDADSYKVYRGLLSDASDRAQLDTTTDTTYVDTSISQTTVYYYWVAVCAGTDCSDFGMSDSGYCASSTIFADSFESGDFRAWSGVKGKGVKIDKTVPMVGSYGLLINNKNKKPKFLTDETPNSEKRYRARFYIDLKGLKLQNKKAFKVFLGRGTGKKKVAFVLAIKRVKKNFFVKALVKPDKGKTKKTKWYPLDSGANYIEIDWQASSSPSAKNGQTSLYVNESIKQKITKIDNDTRVIDEVRLGMVRIKKVFRIKGKFKIDHFDSDKFLPLGP